jgi:hypothetical protein
MASSIYVYMSYEEYVRINGNLLDSVDYNKRIEKIYVHESIMDRILYVVSYRSISRPIVDGLQSIKSLFVPERGNYLEDIPNGYIPITDSDKIIFCRDGFVEFKKRTKKTFWNILFRRKFETRAFFSVNRVYGDHADRKKYTVTQYYYDRVRNRINLIIYP